MSSFPPPSSSPPTGEPTNKKKAFAFFGASTGCGLAALTRALAEGHTCIALCRHPAKLTGRLGGGGESTPENLTIIQGDAHDPAAVRRCLLVATAAPDGSGSGSGSQRLVDAVLTSIGSYPAPSRLFALEDPHVCERGAEVLLSVLRDLVAGTADSRRETPLVVAVSSVGVSRFGRDYPLLAAPVYKSLLRGPHADKRAMEERIAAAAAVAVAEGGGRRYVIVRPSWLVDGDGDGGKERDVRVGVEDWEKGVQRRELGWTISREAVGRWVWERVLKGVGGDGQEEGGEFEGKVVSLTW
ncbi:hypothetical protein F4775DRAFT_415580 [Biscogniauxia sp. FL1348]|nr:hypothetical protein F4775DRAFT_415580 [Biscogniauxia sp. FL1348]